MTPSIAQTNGRGNVSEMTFAEIRSKKLVGPDGNLTDFQVPTLAEVLKWADGKAILSLDIKGGIQPETIVDTIAAYAAESHVMVITYNLATAEAYFQRNPKLMISASAGDMEGFSRLVASEIPAENLVVSTGVSEPERNCMMPFTVTTFAQFSAPSVTWTGAQTTAVLAFTQIYLRNGADILATDNLEMVATAIRKFVSE
ncbi:MAG: glycerophosphodiester phosphodiesterase family protein [Calditrichia bacterium]